MWVALAVLLASAATQAPEASAADLRFDERASAVRGALTAGEARRAEGLARQLAEVVASSSPPRQVAIAEELLAESLLLAGKATGREALDAVQMALGAISGDAPEGHLDRARLQSLAGRVLADRGDHVGARERLEAALSARGVALARCATDRVISLQELATVLLDSGGSDAAKVLIDEARACESAGPPSPLSRARTREVEARLARYEARYPHGLQLAEEARRLRVEAGPVDVPGWIGVLNLIGELDWFLGRFDRSRQWHEQALARAREAFGEPHPTVGTTIANLGHVERSVGNAAEALRLQQQALMIARATRGEDHFETLYALQNLANLHQEQDDYPAALELYEKVHASTMRSFGADSDEAATVLYNLGVLWNRMGQPDRARADVERALRIWEKQRGRDHAYLARPLDVLAEILLQQGTVAEAEARLERSASIRRQAREAQPAELAWTLARLGHVRLRLGKAAAARQLAAESYALLARSSGSDEARIGALGRIGELEVELGRLDVAAARLDEALTLSERRLGRQHPQTARLRAGLASTLLRTGHLDAALAQATEAEAIRGLLLRRTLRYLAEGQALRFAARSPAARDVLLSIASRRAATIHATAAFEALTQSRALVLDEMASRRQTRTAEPGSLEAARQRLANLLYREADGSGEAGAALLIEASDELERLERDEAGRTASERERAESPSADLASLVAALPEATGLVSFVRFRRTGGASKSGHGPDDEYLAFVLRRDRVAPVPEPLGAAATIDAAIARWREVVSGQDALRRPSLDWERRSRAAGREITALVWRPVARHLGGLRRVLIVPDGALGLVSFAALPADGETYVVEKGPILHSLSSERDLLRARADDGPPCSLLAVGGPDYDAPGSAETATAAHPGRESRHARFAFLPHAAAEAKEVADLWRDQGACGTPSLLVGREAHEAALRRLMAGKGALHLATHGFFARSLAETAGGGTRGQAMETATAEVLLRNPLLESGLAFAGANRLAEVSEPADDGLLTAAEVASLDLRSVRWVVLSACGSGIGHVQAGEGVMSLQRAFALAGVGSVVMTLWPVDDREARWWMRSFYRARLTDGASTAEAVREAQLQALGRLRRARMGAPPALWAAFVATGDWR